MKILVIGSKGFIGKAVHTFLKGNADYNVWGCDVVVDYNQPKYVSVYTNSDFSDIFQNEQFDVCINCSGAASVPDSLVNPNRDYLLNTINVFRILEAIRRYNASCKFVNISSAAVYGNPLSLPVQEQLSPNPLSPYGMHKLQSEMICSEFFEFFNIPTCSLRVFSAYGEGLKKQLFWDLYQKAKQLDKVVLFGAGNESRDFIYVSDIAAVIELIFLKAEFKGQSINVANGQEIKISDAVHEFYKQIGWKGEVVFNGEERKGDPVNWLGDISVISSLGYKMNVGFEQGIQQYVSWIKKLE